MAKIRKSGRSWVRVHARTGQFLSRHKTRSLAVKRSAKGRRKRR